ncbi:MAG: site-specific integrase [Methanobrevibacter smithii]
MNITKQNSEVLEKFVFDRNLKNSTKREYKACIDKFTSLFNMGMKDLLAEAEAEEEEGIRWKKRKLKNRLIEYRSFLAKDYYSSTVLGEISRIQTIYRHFGIEIHDLPKLSIKNLKTSKPVVFMDLPDKKIIKDALKIANPIMKAIILFQVSSGCARNETLSLSIADFMEATSEYHNGGSVENVLYTLKDRLDVVPTFRLKRIKTGKYYYTFCTPEAVNEIISYMIGSNRELNPEDKLFDLSKEWMVAQFSNLNNKLKLGKCGTFNRFRSHMLRKFHASQLYNAENSLTLDEIDSLQGRSKNTVRTTYFMENPSNLKEKYIAAMDVLMINSEVETYTVKSEAYEELEKEVENKNEEVKQMGDRLDKVEKMILGQLSNKELESLNEIL